MGTRGPSPKRSDQRRRRNQPATPTRKVEIAGAVDVPGADESWHPLARSWFESLSESGQSRFYETSDWQTARLCAALLSQVLNGDGGAAMVAQIRGMFSDLLVTEGSRRRVSLELERTVTEGAADVSWIEDARARLRAAD